MRLIYVTPFLRVPPDFGMGLRNFHLVQGLAAHHTVQVVAYGEPHPSTEAWLAAHGCTVVRLPYALPWGGQPGRGEMLRLLGQYPPTNFGRLAPQALAQCVADLARTAEVVVFDTQLTGQALLHGQWACPSVVMLADVYEEVRWRQLRTGGVRPYALFYAVDWWKTRQYERQILRRARHLVAVSAEEQALLRRRYPHATVFWLPNGVAAAEFTPRAASPANATVLFVGGFEYAPNVEAFNYVCEHLWPLVRAQHPAAQFVAVGRNPSAAMQARAAQTPGVRLTGTVPDVKPYYAQATVVLAPVQQGGGGAKLKTLEAFAAGVPVVATSVGCEGIVPNIDDYVRRADTPAQLAAHVNAILADPACAQPMAQRARALVEAQFDWPRLAEAFSAELTRIVAAGRA